MVRLSLLGPIHIYNLKMITYNIKVITYNFNTNSCERDGFFERPSLIWLAQKEKYRLSFSVCIKNIVNMYL